MKQLIADQIKELNNVKLIIGNGFDLHCGLRTSYKHFFWLYNNLYQPIIEWYENIKIIFDKGEGVSEKNLDIPYIERLNVWDYFFSIHFVEKGIEERWCDVENVISYSLMTFKENIDNKEDAVSILIAKHHSPINWNEVHRLLLSNEKITDCNGVMSVILKKRFSGFDKYYRFLLDQLNDFEIRFGKFIEEQIEKDISPGWSSTHVFNSKYSECVRQTINNLCGEESISSIDTFNYSYFENESLRNKTHHINGDASFPIFGIDSVDSVEDTRFAFSKTSRRIELEINSYETDKALFEFDDIIIYGHSFNKADFNYFFPVFDRAKLLSGADSSKIVVCYSEEQSDEDVKKLKNDFCKMIIEYGRYSGANPPRLLDTLSTSGRIMFYMVPRIEMNRIMRTPTIFDSPWDGYE